MRGYGGARASARSQQDEGAGRWHAAWPNLPEGTPRPQASFPDHPTPPAARYDFALPFSAPALLAPCCRIPGARLHPGRAIHARRDRRHRPGRDRAVRLCGQRIRGRRLRGRQHARRQSSQHQPQGSGGAHLRLHEGAARRSRRDHRQPGARVRRQHRHGLRSDGKRHRGEQLSDANSRDRRRRPRAQLLRHRPERRLLQYGAARFFARAQLGSVRHRFTGWYHQFNDKDGALRPHGRLGPAAGRQF